MLWISVLILMIPWGLGWVNGYTMGGWFIHVLLSSVIQSETIVASTSVSSGSFTSSSAVSSRAGDPTTDGKPATNRPYKGKMKKERLLAILFIAVGIMTFAYQGVAFTQQKAIPLNPEVTDEKARTIPPPPIAGVIALAGGIMLLLTGSREEG